jgi:2-polyprenyl-3-methyl-5-hydroxy-6-metoxy-1,4-benzoquinol methylase
MSGRAVSEADFSAEVASGERFRFGANWARFLSDLSEPQILLAEQSLRKMLDVTSLEGRSFLDVGCGSGLFSLAARRLGARVHSLDYDPQSVGCTEELRRRYFDQDPRWLVERASVLDEDHMA